MSRNLRPPSLFRWRNLSPSSPRATKEKSERESNSQPIVSGATNPQAAKTKICCRKNTAQTNKNRVAMRRRVPKTSFARIGKIYYEEPMKRTIEMFVSKYTWYSVSWSVGWWNWLPFEHTSRKIYFLTDIELNFRWIQIQTTSGKYSKCMTNRIIFHEYSKPSKKTRNSTPRQNGQNIEWDWT